MLYIGQSQHGIPSPASVFAVWLPRGRNSAETLHFRTRNPWSSLSDRPHSLAPLETFAASFLAKPRKRPHNSLQNVLDEDRRRRSDISVTHVSQQWSSAVAARPHQTPDLSQPSPQNLRNQFHSDSPSICKTQKQRRHRQPSPARYHLVFFLKRKHRTAPPPSLLFSLIPCHHAHPPTHVAQ